jgi:curved DNA-binding protein
MTLSDAMPPRHMEVQVRLSFREALEGGSRDILLPDGRPTTVRWAQGLRPGTTVLRRGQGYRPNGDLLIAFQVDPSPRFRRQGDNLIVTETISVLEAMVGTTRTVQNAYGKSIRVTVRPGVQHGERLRIAGQGVRLAKGSPGDLYVEINLTVPKTLTEEQRAELEACARRLGII